MSKFSWIFAAGMLLASLGTSNAATIVNGGLLGIGSGNFVTLPAGSPGITGWTIGGAGVDTIHTLWASQDGDGSSVDLSALSAGSLSQAISGLVSGASYTVSFYMSGYLSGVRAYDAPTKSLTVDVGGPAQTFTAASTPISAMGWTKKNFVFTASAASQTLRFVSLVNNPVGPALDNISISGTVPVPAAGLMLLSGLGGIVALRRRKSV